MSEAFDNDLHVFSYQFNGDATSKLTVDSIGSVTGDTNSHNWDFGSLMMSYLGTIYQFKGAMYEFIVFDSELTESEVGTIRNHLLTKYGI
jgi:hypothetical protein